MGEVLGTASGIAGLISLSATILSEGDSFLGSVHGAPKELRQLLCETATLDTMLGQLQSLADDGHSADGKKSALTELSDASVLQDCKESLLTVRQSIATCQQISGQGVRNLGKMISWPFKRKRDQRHLGQTIEARDQS